MKHTIIFLVSTPFTAIAFLAPHIRALSKDYDLKVFANTSDSEILRTLNIDISIKKVPIVRSISPLEDLITLFVLCTCFVRIRPLVVHTFTPKAGFLGLLAAWISCVPLRIHSFTGQVWVTRSGAMRWFLKAIDKIMGLLATDVLVDSPSQLDFLLENDVLNRSYSHVLGSGSICGVDTDRFFPSQVVRDSVRSKNGTSSNSLICLYLGRLNRDKGVLLLAQAFSRVSPFFPDVELWVVGPDEAELFDDMLILLGNASAKVKRFGMSDHPERFMQASDLFCLPSYREGFGTSVIEAAACKVPSLVSRIYGLSDAVIEGETGWMHEVGNLEDLTYQLFKLLSTPSELLVRGESARERVLAEFPESLLTSLMYEFYVEKIRKVCPRLN